MGGHRIILVRRGSKPRIVTDAAVGSDAKPRVTFAETVVAWEYERLLGGGAGVPMDGSWVSLGLGNRLRSVSEPLKEEKAGAGKMDLTAPWMASPKRSRLLKGCMGAASYDQIWKPHRREMQKLSRSRRLSTDSLDDVWAMPTSILEAREIACGIHDDLVATDRAFAAEEACI